MPVPCDSPPLLPPNQELQTQLLALPQFAPMQLKHNDIESFHTPHPTTAPANIDDDSVSMELVTLLPFQVQLNCTMPKLVPYALAMMIKQDESEGCKIIVS